ncbi:MAG TPA: diguanylate cyclase [Thermoleophilaceae bacterium]|jgi:diguanylate cyclase (GGDEF)-like protein
MRALLLVVVAIGIAALPLAFGLAAVDRTHRGESLDSALRVRAQDETAALAAYFDRARALDLVIAHNPGFVDFYATGGRRGHGAGHRRALGQAVGALDYIQELYGDTIGEACFIDRAGPEVARVTRGTPATTDDLSTDEGDNPFFEPTFALAPGQVHQAAPYVSPDTHEWVISNSTVVPGTTGRAIVHFEVTIESFRRAAATIAGDDVLRIVDARTGRVVINAGARQKVGAPLGDPRDRSLAPLALTRARSGLATFAGHRSAYRRLAPSRGNANDWYVVASAPGLAPSLAESFGPASIASFALGLAAIALGLAMLGSSRRELARAAYDDALTGLGNRRRLHADLEAALEGASSRAPLVVALFDLNGFKGYNDAFGHAAGDALLERLAHALRSQVSGRGSAYRLGGDEFCVLAPADEGEGQSIVAAAAAALSESGDGFAISASYGAACCPAETREPAAALRLADRRMYAQKNGGRPSASEQSSAVLLRALVERQPDLEEHVSGVAELAVAVADEMGARPEERDRIGKAAELHDIGKVAIPDAILDKPGPLDDEEWRFIKRHTIIGERILGGAPALELVARLVRSSHERWDGAGYPDGLAGEAIPLGSRVIAVCDAYDAMVADRPYRDGRSHHDAVAELERCSGTQFDAAIVTAFTRAMARKLTAALASS